MSLLRNALLFDKSVQDSFNCRLFVLNVFESDFLIVLCKDYDHDCSANLMWTKVNGIGCVYGLTIMLMNPILIDYNYINVEVVIIIVWLMVMMMMMMVVMWW